MAFTRNENSPITNDSIVVRFNKGFKWNGRRFPGCKINATDLTVCPKSTQVGTGTAEASVINASATAQHDTLDRDDPRAG